MISDLAYFDSSALAKLVLPDEVGWELANQLFREAEPACTGLLSYPEAHSALARRGRQGQLAPSPRLMATVHSLREVWEEFIVIPPQESYFFRAADLVLEFSLSGVDAVHLATALDLTEDDELTFVTWDRRQAEAAQSLGLFVQPSID